MRAEVRGACNWAVIKPGNVYRVKKSRRHKKSLGSVLRSKRSITAVNVHLFLFGRTIGNRELLANEFLERFFVRVLENTPREMRFVRVS